MNMYFFVLPETFRPGEFLRDPWAVLLFDDSRYFISQILRKTARGQADRTGHVRLQAKYLRQVMHPHKYTVPIDALREGGAIERSAYAVGKHSFGYRLHDRFVRDKHVRTPVTCARIARRIQAFHERVEAAREAGMKPVHNALRKQQYRLRIDPDLAGSILASLPPERNRNDVQGILVTDILRRDFHFNVGRYGRVSNSITSLKRELRSALRVDGKPLCGVDIVSAQPALLAKLIQDTQTKEKEGRTDLSKKRNSKREGRQEEGIYDSPFRPPIGGDFGEYKRLMQAGTFYEALRDELRRRGVELPRKTLKLRFLRDVLAKRRVGRRGAEYPSPVEDAFRELFPSVYAFVRMVNTDGWEHKNLIRALQREESHFVIETVADAFVERHPGIFLITLHDAIYTTSEHLPKVVDTFHACFELTGFSMQLRTEGAAGPTEHER
jgi:hypothetical protein